LQLVYTINSQNKSQNKGVYILVAGVSYYSFNGGIYFFYKAVSDYFRNKGFMSYHASQILTELKIDISTQLGVA
jgi:hypothetical protein